VIFYVFFERLHTFSRTMATMYLSSVTNVLWLREGLAGKNFLHEQLAWCGSSAAAKFQRTSATARRTFSNLGLTEGCTKNVRFQPKTVCISETVRDRAKVPIEH